MAIIFEACQTFWEISTASGSTLMCSGGLSATYRLQVTSIYCIDQGLIVHTTNHVT